MEKSRIISCRIARHREDGFLVLPQRPRRILPIHEESRCLIEATAGVGKLLPRAFRGVKRQENIHGFRHPLDGVEGGRRENARERRAALALEFCYFPTVHGIAVKVLLCPMPDILPRRYTMDTGNILRP